MMKKSKFVSLSQLASKATGGAYGSQATPAPTAPAGIVLGTPTTKDSGTPGPHTPRGNPPPLAGQKRTWADRVREKLPPLGENEYEVLWERGVLGVIFLESENDGIPYVSKATESCISPLVAPGDILKFVNVVRSKDHSFSEFFKILATMKKPVLLRFERAATSKANSATGSGSRPSSPEIEMLDQRSSSVNEMNGARSAMKEAAKALAAKVQRSNSLPQSENKQKTVTRGTFWRGSSAKEPPAMGVSTPTRREMSSPVTKVKEDDDTDTSESPKEPWDEDDKEEFGDYQYIEVYWETGSLGLFFGEERGTGHPVVTRSTPGVNPSVHRKVQANDVLISANGIRSADYSFEAFFARLQQMNKPVKLVFRRKEAGTAEVPLSRDRKDSVNADPPLDPPLSVSTVPPPSTEEYDTTVNTSPQPTQPPSPKRNNTEGIPPAAPVPSHRSPKNETTQQREPSPMSKVRSSSGEKKKMEMHRHSGGSGNEMRGKSPNRPDIVYLGSPKRTGRGSPQSPPSQLDHPMLSPREDTVTNARGDEASPRRDAPRIPSPSEKREGRTGSVKRKSGKTAIFVLGDDMPTTPTLDLEEDEEEMGVDDDLPAHNASEKEASDVVRRQTVNVQDTDTCVDAEDEVAMGVPFEPSDVAQDVFRVTPQKLGEAIPAHAVGEHEAQPLSPKPLVDDSTETSLQVEVGLPVVVTTFAEAQDGSDSRNVEEPTDASPLEVRVEADVEDVEPLESIEQEDPDIAADLDNNAIITSDLKSRESVSSVAKPNKAAINASLAKYKKKAKNARPLVKLPAITEDISQTVPLVAPNAVNTTVQARGRSKPKPSLLNTPDSSTYLVKWKEGRSVGLQLREVRLAKGTFPLIVDVCKDPCCEALKHVCIGDVIVEINGRNCSTMGVKKTVNFLKTSSKTMLLKFRRGPAFVNERVSACV